MLDLEPIKERLAWVDEEGLNGYTWDIKDTHSQYRDLVAEVERLNQRVLDAQECATVLADEVVAVKNDLEMAAQALDAQGFTNLAYVMRERAGLPTPSEAKEAPGV